MAPAAGTPTYLTTRTMPVLAGMLASLFVVVAAFNSGIGISGERLREIPRILAPDGPDFRRPENPGGIPVPHQDLEMFGVFAPQGPQPGWANARLAKREELLAPTQALQPAAIPARSPEKAGAPTAARPPHPRPRNR